MKVLVIFYFKIISTLINFNFKVIKKGLLSFIYYNYKIKLIEMALFAYCPKFIY